MLFTSYQFIVFLMVVVVTFYCTPKKWQTMILLLASYWFYYFAARGCLIYVILTTIGSYFAARGISKASGKQRKSYKHLKKIWLIMGLVVTKLDLFKKLEENIKFVGITLLITALFLFLIIFFYFIYM